MHDVEKLLTEELRSEGGMLLLDAGAVLAGVRRRRRNRRTVALASVVVVALTGGVAAMVLRAPGPGSADGLVPAHEGGSRVRPRSIRALVIAPDRQGYALSTDCGGGKDCQFRFGVSDDGGSRWTWRPFPGQAAAEGYGMLPFAGGAVVVTADAPDGPKRWVTSDAGRTWKTVSAEPQPPSGADPGNAVVGFGCAKGCAQYGPILQFPDGTTRQIVTGAVPGLGKDYRALPGTDPVVAKDGSIWAAVITTTPDGASSPAVSRDGGHSWIKGPSRIGQPLVVTSWDGQIGYARTQAQDDTVAIQRTGDGGKTWQPFALPKQIRVTNGLTIQLAGPDTLLVHDAGTDALYRSTGNGGFEQVPGVPKFALLLRPSGGDLIGFPDREGFFYASADGVHWRKLGI
jgi:photosystem II stability/assembly factor-like uncharacterized protein